MDRDRPPYLTTQYQPCGKRSQARLLKNFSTVTGIGTAYEAQNPASYMMMMMRVMWIVIFTDYNSKFLGCEIVLFR